MNLEVKLISALEEIDRPRGRVKIRRINYKSMKRRIMIFDETKEYNYHPKDSTIRGKNDKIICEKSSGRKWIKMQAARS